MTKPRNDLTPAKVESYLKLMQQYNVIFLEKGDLKIQMNPVAPKISYPSANKTEEVKQPTEEQLLMNPYVGL